MIKSVGSLEILTEDAAKNIYKGNSCKGISTRVEMI